MKKWKTVLKQRQPCRELLGMSYTVLNIFLFKKTGSSNCYSLFFTNHCTSLCN